MSDTYALENYVSDLRRIASEAPDEDEIFRRLSPLARRLALSASFVRPEHRQTDTEQGFNTFLLHEEPDHSLAVFVVNWLPGRGVPAHDHGTWAVVAGVEGIERNTRYNRLDDRSRDGYAEIEVKHSFDAGPGDVICMKTGGIHSVRNESGAFAMSLHTYGRHLNHTGRSQFDPETNEARAFVVRVD